MAGAIINGNDITELISKIEHATDKSTAYEIVGNYLLDRGISVGRPGFTYKTQFPKTSPSCVSTFARKFQHKDWRDGQDLVQAEQTAGEDGFNIRFHLIETDLDALRDDIKRAFDCLASMRASLFDMLTEVKTELTLINADLKKLEACCREGEQVTFPELRKDLYPGKVLGTVNWLGQRAYAVQTPPGLVVVPHVVEPEGPGNPRVKRVASLAKVLTEDKRIAKAFGEDGADADELIEKFGDIEIDGGWTLGDALSILPKGRNYASPKTLLTAVSDREAAAIRTSGEADQIVAAELGGLMEGTAAAAPVIAFESLPLQARSDLSAAGIKTIGALARADPTKVAAATGDKPGTAAAWVAAARVVTHIG
jgi:hypothetical protein